MRWRAILGGMILTAVSPVFGADRPPHRVMLVQPSAAKVPANLLRLSVVFAAPIEGAVLPRIGLSHADGRVVREPFLPQELWSPDGKVLTLLLHPGRVKTGLAAREQWGPIMREGDDMVLTLDGQPIKRWHIDSVDAQGPVAFAWKLSRVSAGSRQALVVTLDGPIDGRDTNYLAIVGAGDILIPGQSRLGKGESTWTFTPAAAWEEGEYRILVRGTLEDPSGNRLGGHFETRLGLPPQRGNDAEISFKVDADESHQRKP